jgi:trans-aconitate 2-methyltransferase
MTSTATSTGGGWNPEQYDRFRDERSQPFYDLAGMVQHRRGMRVLDLGCGTGELTAWLHRALQASETLGIDNSEAMLAASAAHAVPGLRFEYGDVTALDLEALGTFDLVLSNATLHWVTGHETLFPRLLGLVRPGGQLAVQMPSNRLQPSHYLDAEVAREEPFATALGGWAREDPVREPEFYAALLHAHGVAEQRVRHEVYGHVLPSTRSIVQWVRGALLTAYEQRLEPELYERFVAAYEARLVEVLGEQEPCFYPFRRIFIWARMAEA